MKKLNTAIAISLGLLMPFAAMGASDEEVTIRVMEMNEHSSQAVMNMIELPDVANEEARQQVRNTTQNRHRVRENYDEEGGIEGAGDGEGVGDMDRDRLRDQDQTHAMDQQQDRDPEHEMEFEMEHEMEEQRNEFENEREHEPGNDGDGGNGHGKG